MKKFTIFLFAILLSAAAGSSVKNKTPQEKYIEKYADLAVYEMYRSGVPASITLAQGMLESGNGQSALALQSNNHFGIKCHNWTGEKVYHDDDEKGECFRKYSDPSESYHDHSDFLRFRDRYKFLFEYEVTDYKSWAYGLKKAGYATDPSYPQKLVRLIEEYELYRYDLECLENRKRPESPSSIERAKPLNREQYETFHFPLSRQMYSTNGVPFVYSAEGETYADIAARYNLFHKEILRYNDIKTDRPLYPGTVVYLQKKKRQAAKGLEKHIVETSDETLTEIAQRYAVRLSSLCRLNNLTEGHVLKEVEVIKLRK